MSATNPRANTSSASTPRLVTHSELDVIPGLYGLHESPADNERTSSGGDNNMTCAGTSESLLKAGGSGHEESDNDGLFSKTDPDWLTAGGSSHRVQKPGIAKSSISVTTTHLSIVNRPILVTPPDKQQLSNNPPGITYTSTSYLSTGQMFKASASTSAAVLSANKSTTTSYEKVEALRKMVKKTRKEKGLTREKLAETLLSWYGSKCTLTYHTVKHFELGEYSNIHMAVLYPMFKRWIEVVEWKTTPPPSTGTNNSSIMASGFRSKLSIENGTILKEGFYKDPSFSEKTLEELGKRTRLRRSVILQWHKYRRSCEKRKHSPSKQNSEGVRDKSVDAQDHTAEYEDGDEEDRLEDCVCEKSLLMYHYVNFRLLEGIYPPISVRSNC
eukprot:scpid51497/ scgid27191/ 